MNHDIRPSQLRSFYERHTMLCEFVSMVCACSAVAVVMYYALTI